MLTTGLVLSEDWVVTVATTLGPREGELKKNYEKKGTSQVNFRNTEINLFSCIKDDVLREFLCFTGTKIHRSSLGRKLMNAMSCTCSKTIARKILIT